VTTNLCPGNWLRYIANKVLRIHQKVRAAGTFQKHLRSVMVVGTYQPRFPTGNRFANTGSHMQA
jgi:hypothetical protein